MKQSQRKFVGVFAAVFLLVGYAMGAVWVFEWQFAALPTGMQLVYFAVTGLAWAIPAAFLIRWMQAPDADAS